MTLHASRTGTVFLRTGSPVAARAIVAVGRRAPRIAAHLVARAVVRRVVA
jgi:hypothetical protein